MGFTYTDTLLTDLDKLRYAIQDTVADQGIKPNGSNFSDEEIGGLVTLEGSWQRATAAAFEALSSIWATQENYNHDGLNRTWDASKHFRELAKKWRAKYGYGDDSTDGTAVQSRPVTRTDAYSDDLNAIESSTL